MEKRREMRDEEGCFATEEVGGVYTTDRATPKRLRPGEGTEARRNTGSDEGCFITERCFQRGGSAPSAFVYFVFFAV
jgi:hypothetical protein